MWRPVILTAVFVAMPLSAAAQAPLGGIVVFGTSLSDPGNAFTLVGGTNTPPDYRVNPSLIPFQPYARSGRHFTNGATWVEQLARPLGLAASVQPAFRGSVWARNFAVGAARANDDPSGVDLSLQVSLFLALGHAPADALYVVEMGINDVRDAFFMYAAGGDGGPIVSGAINSIAENIAALYAAGAKTFLVWNSPNIALSPAVRAQGPAAMTLANTVTQGFNLGLEATLSTLPFVLPEIEIIRLDAYQLLHDIVMNPAAFGLTNVENACIQPGVPPFRCEDVSEYLFWDGIHPTARAHGIIADQAALVLGF
jgi:phospholipase/lecithinase/hemolysin